MVAVSPVIERIASDSAEVSEVFAVQSDCWAPGSEICAEIHESNFRAARRACATWFPAAAPLVPSSLIACCRSAFIVWAVTPSSALWGPEICPCSVRVADTFDSWSTAAKADPTALRRGSTRKL